MFSEFFSILWKNFKIVFRTPSLLFLVIIGPLSLILLVGTAFSSNVPEGALIGTVSDYNAPKLELSVPTTPYSDKVTCESHLKRGKLEACIYIQGDIESEEPVKVEIVFDETRPSITNLIVREAQEVLGLTSGDISEKSTAELVNELNEIIYFAKEVQYDLNDFIEQSDDFQQSLYEAEASLRNALTELNNQERELISTQNELNQINDVKLENDERDTYYQTSNALSEAEYSLNLAINDINDSSITSELISVRNDITEARNEINYYHNQFQRGISALRSARVTITNSLNRISQIKSMINSEILKVENAQQDAEIAKQRLLNIQQDLQSKLPQQDFSESFAKKIANPIQVELRSTLPTTATNIQLLFPLIAGTVAMFISLLLGNILTLSEIHSPAYLRTVISPLSRFWFILGIFVTNLILVFFQMSVLFNTGAVNFSINIFNNIWILVGFVTLSIMTFTLIGMLIAYLVNSEQTSILIATFAVLFLFLLSDAVFPVEVMPAFARFIASVNPLMIFKELFRYSLFYKPNFLDVGWQLFLSTGYIIGGFILIIFADWGFKRKNLK